MIPQNHNVERKSNIFPFIMAYTSRPSVPTTCDRTSSRHPLTTDVEMPIIPLTKNWTGWTLCYASQGPEWTELLVPSNAAAALWYSGLSVTTASLTSSQGMSLLKDSCPSSSSAHASAECPSTRIKHEAWGRSSPAKKFEEIFRFFTSIFIHTFEKEARNEETRSKFRGRKELKAKGTRDRSRQILRSRVAHTNATDRAAHTIC